MLFNSYPFSLLFLPLTLLLYGVAVRYGGRTFALGWLLLASVFFYAWSSLSMLAILGSSILLNYGSGRLLARARVARNVRGRFVMALAVTANLLILGQFKYLEFLVEAGAALVGIDLPLVRSIPPLAISFFTFQQIAYVVDVHRGQPAERNLLRYGLFVCFFPQLIAGPIVHHKEMLPQFNRASLALKPQDLAVGITLFAMGLFKKVVIADGIADWVTPVFTAAALHSLTAVDAWSGALAFTLQLYFDFSGYCDMAIGLGLMFGFRLPINFDSPYRATSIIDFWRRWHKTLSRFLRDYLYFGLGGNRRGRVRRYVNLMLTMLLGGLWHGANWTFLVWGALHGFFIIVNHAWRSVFSRAGRVAPDGWGWRCASRVLTLVAVVVAWVFFRADSLGAAWHMVCVMAGVDGLILGDLSSRAVVEHAPLLIDRERIIVLLGLLALVSFAPNSQQIVGYAGVGTQEGKGRETKAEEKGRSAFATSAQIWAPLRVLRWSPSASWAAVTALLFLLSLVGMSEVREFVYFRF